MRHERSKDSSVSTTEAGPTRPQTSGYGNQPGDILITRPHVDQSEQDSRREMQARVSSKVEFDMRRTNENSI